MTITLPKDKPRNVAAVNMYNRRQKAGAFPDRKKDKNKKACRGKVRDDS
jgi:hypothetical protein